jgi:crotonobetainyl-CoA:carnitine CoA-transferase CaiB-like acyl-CoA transferase
MSGLMTLTGKKLGQPVGTAFSVVDRMASLYTTVGALAALLHRAATGEGQSVDVSLMDTALSMVEVPASYFLSSGVEGGENGRLAYATADGWVVINAVTADQRAALMEIIAVPAEDQDPSVLWTSASEKQPAFLEVLRAWAAERTSEDVCSALEAVAIPVGSCRTISEVAGDPLVMEREILVERGSGEHPVFVPGPSVKLSRTPARAGPVPGVGEHTGEVLRELLGYSAAKVEELTEAGAFGLVS